MITPFPVSLSGGITVELADRKDLIRVAGNVPVGRHQGRETVAVWLPFALRGPKRTTVVIVGFVGGAEPCALAVQALDGENAVRTTNGKVYRLGVQAADLHLRHLSELWQAVREWGLVDAA
jgi:hypothetical protein